MPPLSDQTSKGRKKRRGTIKTKVTRRKHPKSKHDPEVLEEDVRPAGSVVEGEHIAAVKVAMGTTWSEDYQSISVYAGIELPVVLDTGPFRCDEPFDAHPIEEGIKTAEKIVDKHLRRIHKELDDILDD